MIGIYLKQDSYSNYSIADSYTVLSGYYQLAMADSMGMGM